MMLAIEFPNPIDWAADPITQQLVGAAADGFELALGGLTGWVLDAAVWVVGGVFNFFLDSSDPNVQADWFITGSGPYATTATIGATLLLLFVLAGIVQGTLSGDTGGMLRRMAVDLPMSVLGMVGLVSATQALIRLTDALSMGVMDHFQDDIEQLVAVVATLDRMSGGQSTAFVVFVLALVTTIAGLILLAELVIRSALIYIVVALAPLVFAARVWPATRDATRKLLELLCALILSKLVIAIALAVAASAAVGAGSGGDVTALPEPEVFAEDPGGSVTQAVGVLLTAAAAFGVAAFSPMVVAKLLPMTETAAVSQGLRSGPMRAGQQGMYMTNSARAMRGQRLNQLASGKAGSGSAGGTSIPAGAGSRPPSLGAGSASGGTGTAAVGSSSAGGGGAAAGAGGASAAAGPVGVVVAVGATGVSLAKGALKKGTERTSQSVEAHASAGDRPAPQGPRSSDARPAGREGGRDAG